jgi:hypothetical protein
MELLTEQTKEENIHQPTKHLMWLSIIGKDLICCRIESKVSSDVLLAGVCFPLLSVPSKVP